MKLPRFDQARVLTIGDVVLDRYWHGSTERISAEAPIPIVDVTEIEERLGCAANVALNISSLGAASALIGAVGDDESGRIIKTKLQSLGIVDHLVNIPDYQTITKLRILSRQQQLVRADFEKISDIKSDFFNQSLEQSMNDCDVVVMSDYDKGMLANTQHFVQAAIRSGKPVLVDPKFKNYSAYQGATLIKPNQKECEAAIGAWSSETELVEKCQIMIQNLGLEAMLITRGSEGLTLIEKGQQEFHVPAMTHEVFDVSGAGDTVIAVVASALASGETLKDAIGMASIAAGIVVGRVGTASVSGPELRLEVAKNKGFSTGVMTEEQLVIAVEAARGLGEKVVFTNGCFDILHAGHVDYLSEARKEGDRLIVAINGDESVRRLKGEGRPINNIDLRLSMMAGLAAVDWVVSFESDTPEELIRKLQPEVLVKGGDYTLDGVVGADIVAEYNGEVKVLNLVDGLSTTSLAEKIKRL